MSDMNTSVFLEFSSKKLLVIQFFILTNSQFGVFHWAAKLYIGLSIISITAKVNPVFPDDISQG